MVVTQVEIKPRESETLNGILNDLITSSAFFKQKNIGFKEIDGTIKFLLPDTCSTEYLMYLQKYDLSINYF